MMNTRFILQDGRLIQAAAGPIRLVRGPDQAEREALAREEGLDPLLLEAAVDPHEPARLELEPLRTSLIVKVPVRRGESFEAPSAGLFLTERALVIILPEEAELSPGPRRLESSAEALAAYLDAIVRAFVADLHAIDDMVGELEESVRQALDNEQLLRIFALEKSLVYYLSAVDANAGIIERLESSGARVSLPDRAAELLADVAAESRQALRQAEIQVDVLANLMDARAQLVNNNINVLMKRLNVAMISLMVPTLVVSVFSMNLPLPVRSFWAVLALAITATALLWAGWRRSIW